MTGHHRTIWHRKETTGAAKEVSDFYGARSAIYALMIKAIGHRRSLRKYFEAGPYVHDRCRILDAGCGDGALIDVLHGIVDKRGLAAEFYGFDLTPEMLRQAQLRARRRTCHATHLMPADVRDVPHALPDSWAGVDAVVTAGMLEYLAKEELAPALGNLRAMLKPGGSLVAFISRDGAFNRKFLGNVWKANLYAEEELRAAFDQPGLRLTSIKPFRTWGFAVEAVAA